MKTRQMLKRKAAQLTDAEVSEVLDYISIMESMRAQAPRLNQLHRMREIFSGEKVTKSLQTSMSNIAGQRAGS